MATAAAFLITCNCDPICCSFPLEGGTGGIWKAVAKLLPPERQRYRTRLTAIDREKQIAQFDDGRQVGGS